MQSFQSHQYIHGLPINQATRVRTLIAGKDSPTPQRQYMSLHSIIYPNFFKIDFLTTFMAEYCEKPLGVGLLKMTLGGFRPSTSTKELPRTPGHKKHTKG